MLTMTGKNLPAEIRRWLREKRITLKSVTGHQVNRLHIKVELPRRSIVEEIHFVLVTRINTALSGDHHPMYGPQPGWTFATGELRQAADRLCRT